MPVAIRAYTEKVNKPDSKWRKANRRFIGWPDFALILDTETTTDAVQRLLFGSYRILDLRTGQSFDEGLFYADDLTTLNSESFEVLNRYAKAHSIKLQSTREFLDKVLWPIAKLEALIVGFNLPFDLSRLACGWSAARGAFRNGISLQFWKYKDKKSGKLKASWFKPSIRIKHVDSKRSFIRFSQPRRDSDQRSKGSYLESHFLDLRTLGFALTNQAYSLERACSAFGVEHGKIRAKSHGTISDEYIEYNRRDVLATAELLLKLREEFDRNPISLDPCRASSPASMAKAYLREMGLTAPAKKFTGLSKKLLGHCMAGYFGGRAEARIRKRIVPVVYVDFLSMYPTVNALMDLWSILTAADVRVVDATERVRELLGSITLERCLDPNLWKNLRFVALIQPNKDILPVRAEYGSNRILNIGVNIFSSDRPLWYMGPDLAASILLSGKAPKVVKAFALEPVGRQPGLKPIKLRGAVEIDPTPDDFFREIVEHRQRIKKSREISDPERKRLSEALKVIANSGSYGIFAEMNPEDLAPDEKAEIEVFGLDEPFRCKTSVPETPGEFFCAPIAALIPAAARLILAILERCVTDAGGAYAFCDTDSMAIVSTEDGEFIPDIGRSALSHAEVDEIVERFSPLNPYDRALVPSILKIEDENFRDGKHERLFALCISAKRYALFNRTPGGGIEIRKCSEHGLGHLLNPLDPDEDSASREKTANWIEEFWRMIIARESGQIIVGSPEWMDRPALSRISATTPEIIRRLNSAKKNATYADQVKPFSFILTAHVMATGYPEGADPEKFQLIASFTSHPRKWLKLLWINQYTGEKYSIITRDDHDTHRVRVKSYRDVFDEYANHPEPKSADSSGNQCARVTRGLLQRRHVYLADLLYVGKEAKSLEEVEHGLIHNLDEAQERYFDPREPDAFIRFVIPILKSIPLAYLEKEAGRSERLIRGIRNRHRRASQPIKTKLTHLSAEYVRHVCGITEDDDLAACIAFGIR